MHSIIFQLELHQLAVQITIIHCTKDHVLYVEYRTSGSIQQCLIVKLMWWLLLVQGMLFDALASSNEKVKRVLDSKENPEKYKDNIGKVTVYFQEFNYQTIWEEPRYIVS